MPLTGTEATLAAAIKAKLIEKGFVASEYEKFTELTEAIAEALIPHLINNTLVTTTSGAPDNEHGGIIS
ncbi:hypothetical protein KAR91_37295 [Candidatus Pacearchaeota archaeon]|nr:hypothetical protein [Candidatus Pacearchaeota archaeon]